MTVRYFIHGVRVHIITNPYHDDVPLAPDIKLDDYEPEIHKGMQILKMIKEMHPDAEILHYTLPKPYIRVSSEYGADEIQLYAKPKKGEELVEKIPREKTRVLPVPAYLLYDGADFIGWYVCDHTGWDSPPYIIPADTGEPRMTTVNVGASGSTTVEIFPLDQIDERDTADYDGDWDYENPTDRWGENEEWLSPEHAVTGDATLSKDWVLTAYSPSAAWMRSKTSGITYKVWMNNSCMRTPAIEILQDRYSKSYFTSFPIENEAHTAIYPPAGMQYWNRRSWYEETDSMSIGGNQIYSMSAKGRSWSYSRGQFSGDCESLSFIEELDEGSYPESDENCSVRDRDNYTDDQTFLAAWGEDITDFYSKREISPWMHEPYSWVGDPDPFVDDGQPPGLLYYTQHRYVTARAETGAGEVVHEYAAPEYGSYDDDDTTLDSVFPWDIGIWDFFGEPVFVWSWRDERDESMNYGLIYAGNVVTSIAFPWDPPFHTVYDADKYHNGKAKGFFCVCGLRITSVEENVETIES